MKSVVLAHAGDDAEVQVIAPASKITWLDRLTNAEDDARVRAYPERVSCIERDPREGAENRPHRVFCHFAAVPS